MSHGPLPSSSAATGISTDLSLWKDFLSLCDCGGRLAGSPSEQQAFDIIRTRVGAATGVPAQSIPVPYRGWTAGFSYLGLHGGELLPCHPLLRSVPTHDSGLVAEVIDIGRGTPEEFEAHASEIAGRTVLVRHELMFYAGTIHRRLKYNLARQHGAVGFLIAGALPGGLVAGSTGRADGDGGIPAAGISPETAARLRRTEQGHAQATLLIQAHESDAQTETLLFELPGQTDEWVVLSAHVDGHDLAESAMDNATGLAGVMAIARELAPRVKTFRRGLRVMFFSVEEWGLTGSTQYVHALAQGERDKIALNVNLDSIAGSPHLAALTSAYPGVEPFVLQVAAATGQSLRTVRPMMANSDHAAFAHAGIPAIRLVAGFDDADAQLRHVLTSADTRDKVAPSELREATMLSAAIVEAACQAGPQEALVWRTR
jgi:hypothetical protein